MLAIKEKNIKRQQLFFQVSGSIMCWIFILALMIPAYTVSSWNYKGNDISDDLFNRVCYYVPDKTFTPSLIDPTLCTHIIFGFAQVINNTIQPSKPTDIQFYRDLNALKTKNPSLKTLISIGGGGVTGGFNDTVRTEDKRTKFIKQSLIFMQDYGFDGLDIDWEFPGWIGGSPDDKKYFTIFLKEFHSTVLSANLSTLLTAAVAAVIPLIGISYDIPEMAKYVDFVNIMCYDYHFYQKIEPFTAHNSPLFKNKDDIVYLNTLNIEWTANHWYEKGMPKKKIMLGLPTYGHTYELGDPQYHSLYDFAIGPGSGGGWITYPQVCDLLKNGGVHVFDNESMVPYAYKDTNWASYDDIQSFAIKAKWIAANNFGGAMTWNLNCDDWQAVCDNKTAFPLHKTLRDNLRAVF